MFELDHALALDSGFRVLYSLLLLESMSSRGKLLLLLVCLSQLLSLFSSHALELGPGFIDDALTLCVHMCSVCGCVLLDPLNLGQSHGFSTVDSLRSLCSDTGDHFWIALYNDCLLEEVLLQVMMNMHFSMMLYIGTGIDLHVNSDVLVSVSLEHLWNE